MPDRLSPIRRSIRALREAGANSLAGLRFGLSSERAVRQEVAVLLPAILLAPVVADGPWQAAGLIAVLLLLLAVELLNTAVEKLCDHLHPDRHPAIARVKDLGSAAVLCAIGAVAMLWGAALVAAVGRWSG